MDISRFSLPVNCEHPVRIFNRYTGRFEYVPCGSCTACRLRDAGKQTMRVSSEIKEHRYSVFFTLTYNNKFVPHAELFEDSNGVIQCRPIGRTSDMYDRFPLNSCDKYGEYLIKDDTFVPSIEHDLSSDLTFAVACKRDVQNFIKRLRFLISKTSIPAYEQKIRYYISCEYGPKTFRPHYHGILFFDSPLLSTKITDFIVSAWSVKVRVAGKGRNCFSFQPFADPNLTRNYVKFCDSNTSYYVADYVTGNVNLPSLLRFSIFRPFHIQSKDPVIGLFKNDSETLLSSISRGTITHLVSRTDSKKGITLLCDVPFTKDSVNSVWRKCYRYSELSFDAKHCLYSFCLSHIEEYENEVNSILKCLNIKYSLALSKGIVPSFRSWCKDRYSDSYNSLFVHDVTNTFGFTRFNVDDDSSWYASLHCMKVLRLVNFNKFMPFVDPVHVYISLFDKYLYLSAQYQLKRFYDSQNDFIDTFGRRSLACFYPDLLNDLIGSRNYLTSPFYPLARFIYGQDLFTDSGRINLYDYSKDNYYKLWLNTNYKHFQDKNKSKKVNNTLINNCRILN